MIIDNYLLYPINCLAFKYNSLKERLAPFPHLTLLWASPDPILDLEEFVLETLGKDNLPISDDEVVVVVSSVLKQNQKLVSKIELNCY